MAFLFQEGVEEQHPDEMEQKELLIFGYHCKLFRDDEKAYAIDAGEHLIPWMGDHRVMIDRYDGRGHLFDLGPYDADNKNNWESLSADELRIERLCDEERYLELHTDIAEKAIQEEEELKRLNQELAETDGYQAVAFNYDNPNTAANAPESSSTESATAALEEEEEDTPFLPPPELSLPKSMTYPEGNKLNSLIEKTAKFVSQHGGQMEIMIKTKQADNPQFEFLNFEHPLNPYYKHQVYMIKNGRYNPDIHNKQQQQAASSASYSKTSRDGDTSDSDDDDDGGYLHPSLMAKSTNGTTNPSTTITAQYTQSQLADTAYGRLLKKLADNNPSLTNSPQRVATPGSETSQDDYYNYQSSDAGDTTSVGYSNSTDYNSQYYYTDANGYGYYHARPPSPTIDIKPLIERILAYIKKDGEEFEKKVIQKNDYRFSFLHPHDPNHQYYLWRKAQYLGEDANSYLANKASISFSIKQKDPEPVYVDGSKKAALPVDPDSEEESNSQSVINSVSQFQASDVQSQIALVPSYVIHAPPKLNKPAIEKPDEAALKAAEAEAQQRKIAEQKLRDKLAAASREKLTQVTANTKEKALQAERKKKAAMFVELLKAKKSQDHPVPIGPELPKSMSNQRDSESRVKYTSESNSDRRKSRRSRSPHSSHSHSRNNHSDKRRDRSSRDSRDSRHRDSRDSKDSRKSRSRRSPSPLPSTTLSSAIKRRRSRSKSPHYHKSSKSLKPQEDSNLAEEKTIDNNEVDLEYLEKMKSMLKLSRRKVYQEDLFGND